MQESFVSADTGVGAPPGLEYDDIVKRPDGSASVCVTCIDYGPGRAQQQRILDVVRTVITLSYAVGILNLISLFDPELVLIEVAETGLTAESRQRIRALARIPDINIEETIHRQMGARGLTPPVVRSTTYTSDTIMRGAALLLVDAFLRTPPVARV